MSPNGSILVVDDDRYDNNRYCQLLRSGGYSVQSVIDAEQAMQTIRRQRFDVVIVDMLLPMRLQDHLDFGGIIVLRQIKERDAATQVIAVTGYGNRELAAEAMAAGAFDYITKDLDTEQRLPGVVRVAVARAKLLRAEGAAHEPDGEARLNMPNHLVADSAAMRQALRRAQVLADIDGPLLIVGEPGAGKELIARVVHINSRYATGPFVVVACRKLSGNLAELWGQAPQLAPAAGVQRTDIYARYEHGLHQLLQRMGQAHARYAEVLVFQQRLDENITQSRQYGDATTLKSERAEIIDRLNELTLSELGISFGEWCGQAALPARQPPAGQAPVGFCAQAEGGTLVLKGIQDLPFNQQKQLVGLVRDRIYQPFGAKELVGCNLRIIATTSANLELHVRHGRFWHALYEVLRGATLDVPPLRERRDKDDIMAIAGYLLHHYDLASGIAPEAADLLVAYDYSAANIKELEEILRAAAVQSGGEAIRPAHLPPALHGPKSGQPPTEPAAGAESVELSVRFVPGNSATLIWDSPAGGSTRSRLDLPFAEADVTLVLRALATALRPEHPATPLFDAAEQALLTDLALWDGRGVVAEVDRRVGHLLHQAVLTDPAARSAVEGAWNIAINKRRSLAITLRFPPEAIALASLPWELLWEEHRLRLRSRAKPTSCVRYLEFAQSLLPLPAQQRPLRLLIICPKAGTSEQLHAEEQAGRASALQPLAEAGLLVVEELPSARKSDLTTRLQDGAPVNILHFYGRGIWKDAQTGLMLDDGPLDADQIAALFGDVPLVMLQAGRSGADGTSDLFAGIAPALSAAGIAAVIAMQFAVSAEAANRFSVVLYQNLARGELLQTAAAKARQAIYAEHKESWYVPVVYVRSGEPRPVYLVRA